MPSDADLITLYSPKTGYQKSKSKKQHVSQPVHKMYGSIIEYATSSSVNSVVDIGCSTGDFLVMAKKAGLDVCGVEPNSTTADAARARDLVVHTGYLSEVSLEDKKFDMVFLGDVIEHVRDPQKLIDEAVAVMNDGGYIAICTPNADCFWSRVTLLVAKVFGVPWSVATPPYHISIFTPSSLDRLLQSHNMTLQKRWYNHLPNLRYEIGSTGVWKQFKTQKSIRSLFHVVVTAVTYPILFMLNKLLAVTGRKNMGMVSIYKSNQTT